MHDPAAGSGSTSRAVPQAPGIARFTFVVGKGGVGKTTTAGELAARLARESGPTHLISTDPAHSLTDYFDQALEPGRITANTRNEQLLLEEFDASAFARRWLERARPALTELVERGSYLDAADASAFLDRAFPGVDEVMAAFRIAELETSAARHIVIDTAPTGHALRFLSAPDTVATWIDALDAMAAKAETVAAALVGNSAGLRADTTIDEWRAAMERYRRILETADFIVVTRPDTVVHAETQRLLDELRRRGLRVTELVEIAPVPTGDARPRAGRTNQPSPRPAVKWLRALPQRIVFFAGKGGVGKSTCACAAAQAFATRGRTLLLSTDPAGSLSDILGAKVGDEAVELAPRLYVRQLDAAAALQRWRDRNRARFEDVLASLGVTGHARLDHHVITRFWQLAPPGLDELIAFSEILDAATEEQTVVVDSAPTGHFLRLLAMPDMATDWTHAAMRLILRYNAVSVLEDVARDLLDFAQQTRRLRETFSDPRRTAVIVVTLSEPIVEAETRRLQAALENATIPTSAILFNRADAGPGIPRSQDNAGRQLLRAPEISGGITGPAGLLRFVNRWELLD